MAIPKLEWQKTRDCATCPPPGNPLRLPFYFPSQRVSCKVAGPVSKEGRAGSDNPTRCHNLYQPHSRSRKCSFSITSRWYPNLKSPALLLATRAPAPSIPCLRSFCFEMGKMAFFAGNLTIQFSVDLGSRNLLIPWVKKASAISCSKASQSYFVRCICRNYSQSKGGNSPHHSSYSTFLKVASTQGSWILHDGARYQCSYTKRIFDAENELSEDDIGHDLGVEDQGFSEVFERPNAEFKIFNHNDASEMDAPSMSMAKQDARTMAIEVLAKRALTTVELHKKLRGKKFPLHEVEAVIADFQGRGLLNDYLYAETFSRSRWFSLSWGPRRIKQALLRKGVTEQDAERAMKQVFQDGDCGADQGTHLGMSKVSLDRLLAEASKQWLRGKDVPLETRKSRIVRWLQYRGFNWGITSFVLKKLESQHPP